jgi:hypothetical protein
MTKIICRACGEEAQTGVDRLMGLKTPLAVCRTRGCKNENCHAVVDSENSEYFNYR